MNIVNEHMGSEEEVTTYVIKFRGKYLKKIGWRGNIVWVDTLAEAKLYPSEEVIKKDLNKAARQCPDAGPFPTVEELKLLYVSTIDHTQRFLKNRLRAAKARETKEKNYYERNLERNRENALVRLQEAQREYERAKSLFDGFGRTTNNDDSNPMHSFGYGRGDEK